METVYEVLLANEATLTAEQASQAVVTIRDLQRTAMCCDDVTPDICGDASLFLAKKFNADLKESPVFNMLLRKVSKMRHVPSWAKADTYFLLIADPWVFGRNVDRNQSHPVSKPAEVELGTFGPSDGRDTVVCTTYLKFLNCFLVGRHNY